MLLHFIKIKKIDYNFLKINLLLVIGFSFLYYIDSIYFNTEKDILDCIYYSLVTQSTVGYADIIPKDTSLMKHITIFQLLSIFLTLSFH